MSEDIGNLNVRISADTSGLEDGLDKATQATGRYRDATGRLRESNGKFVAGAKSAGNAIDKTAQSTDAASSSMARAAGIASRLSGILAAVGAAAGFGQAIQQISNFQGAMNGLAAVSGATAMQMGSLEEQARSLGATSQFSAQQAAEAQRFLAQAGFEVNEALGATPGILKLATAGQLDLASAADIASNVLGGMRMDVSELNRVNDVLAATASRSNTDIRQLGQALSFAAPFAAGAGVSIEEAAAAIGNMSDAGIQASRAGTGLVGTIRQLSNVTDSGKDVLSQYGLSVADVNIEARGLGPVLETLRGANLSTADAIALFGSEAGAAAQVLVNGYGGAITGATGEAERMADQINQGLGPAFRSLQSAMSESVLQAGDAGLAGALENLVRTSTGVISVFNGMGNAWAESNDVGQDALSTVEGIATALEVFATLVGSRLVVALGSYTGAQIAANAAMLRGAGAARALSGAMALVGGPIGLLVGAGGLLFAFRDELGLVPRSANQANEVLANLGDTMDGVGESAVNNNLDILIADLEATSLQAQETAARLTDLEARQRFYSDSHLGVADSAKQAAEQERALLEEQQGRITQLTDAIAKQREYREELRKGTDGEGDKEDGAGRAKTPGAATGDSVQEQEKERERLREHLAQRLEIIRESMMSEKELAAENHEQKMETLAEIREQELVTEQEYRQLKEDAEAQHLNRMKQMEQKTADDRAKIEQRHADTVVGMRKNVVRQSVALLDMFAGESKAAALASIALQKGLAIAETVMNTQVAQMRALAELGPIAGPPVAAKIGALGAVSTGIIAAQGLAQAASAMGGGGSSSLGSAGGGSGGGGAGSANQPASQQPAAPQGGTLTVQGINSSALFTGDAVRELAEELISYQKRGGTIVVE